jgi:hypothetical protein
MPTSSGFLRGCTTEQAVSRSLLTVRPGFVPRAVHKGFVVDKVATEQVFLRVLRLSPVNIIPLLLHIYSGIIWGWDKMSLLVAAVPQT